MPAQNTSVSLGDYFTRYARAQVEQGRFGTISEVLRAGLRLLEEREQQLEAVNQALIDGENSGPAVPFDWDDFYVRMHREAETEAKTMAA